MNRAMIELDIQLTECCCEIFVGYLGLSDSLSMAASLEIAAYDLGRGYLISDDHYRRNDESGSERAESQSAMSHKR